MEVLTSKIDPVTKQKKFKVRLAARGDLQSEFGETFSPVPYVAEQRLFLCMVIGLGLILVQGDISSAFLHGRLSSPVFFYLPQGHPLAHRKDLVYRSEAAVYGLKESGRI